MCFPLRQGTNFVVTFALLSYGSCMWKNYNSDLPPRVVHKVTLDRVFVPFHGVTSLHKHILLFDKQEYVRPYTQLNITLFWISLDHFLRTKSKVQCLSKPKQF